MTKRERYLAAREAGKSVEEAVTAALPTVDPKSDRFKNWVNTADHNFGFKEAEKVKPVANAKSKSSSKKAK